VERRKIGVAKVLIQYDVPGDNDLADRMRVYYFDGGVKQTKRL